MSEEKQTVTISFRTSTVKGIKLKSYHGKEFYGFLGIPYAQPPLGELRFMPPQPVERYPENIDATKFKEHCIQRRYVHSTENIGAEDCLYMNIFIPQLPTKNQKPKAVLFNVFGGGYTRGRTHWFQQYPNTLMEYDVIYVNFVYRLHVLGFLNLGMRECPGNVGLKDQVAALKWVVSNINYFGGDPNNITVHGTSSGGSCAAFLTMTPLAKGLFTKAITGSPLSMYPWNFENKPVERAFKFARTLGFQGTDKNELLDFYKKQPIERLFNAIFENQTLDSVVELLILWGTYEFRPSVELIQDGAFFPDSPYNLWQNVNSIKIIAGVCDQEGVTYYRETSTMKGLDNVDAVKNLLRIIVRDAFVMDDEIKNAMYEEMLDFYFKEEVTDEDSLRTLLQICGDTIMRDNYVAFKYMKKPGVETFNYLFSYVGNLNSSRKVWGGRFLAQVDEGIFPAQVEGAFHSDEHGYFFETPSKHEDGVPNEDDLKMIRYVNSYYTNFAKTGNPNGEGLDREWKPSSLADPCYLRFDKDLELVKGEMFEERVKFWNYLMNKYCDKTIFS